MSAKGSALTTFAAALQPADADQALAATKDPYVFDFLELAEDAHERDLERALVADIQKFVLELGTVFAFYGRQKPLFVGEQEFFIDLLFPLWGTASPAAAGRGSRGLAPGNGRF